MNERDMRKHDLSASTSGGEPPELGRASVIRHEEELEVGAETRAVGAVRVGKRVEVEQFRETIPRAVEDIGDIERTGPNEQDSGEVEVLDDGSVSVPILEEELVISKRTVVRERVIVRKRTETRDERVEAELRKERVEVEADSGVEVEEGR